MEDQNAEQNAAQGISPEVMEKLRAQQMADIAAMAGQAAQPLAPPDHKEQLMGRRADYINRIANIDHLIEMYDANPEIGEFLVYSQTNPI